MGSAKVLPKSLLLDIQKLDLSVYEDIIREFVRRFSQCEGVLWIGQIGSLSAPGVSDIDLMLVCKDDFCRDTLLASNDFITQSPLYRYLFIHDVFVIPQSGLKWLFFFHPVDNLQTLWGTPEIFNVSVPVDETIRLFRAVHWASSNWSKTLHFCNQDSVSLRSILVRSKSLVTAAYHNHFLMGTQISLSAETKHIDQERQQILSADPEEKSNLARSSFWNAVQALAKSDSDLSTWMIQRGFSNGFYEQKKVWLSEKHLLIFDDSQRLNPANFHQHTLGMHITHLPFYYYTIGFLVSQPYIRLEPSLSRFWDVQSAMHVNHIELKEAAEKWNNAFWENVNGFRKAGLNPLALDVYPYNMPKADTIIMRLLKQGLPTRVRHWLRGRQESLVDQK